MLEAGGEIPCLIMLRFGCPPALLLFAKSVCGGFVFPAATIASAAATASPLDPAWAPGGFIPAALEALFVAFLGSDELALSIARPSAIAALLAACIKSGGILCKN